jgi:4-amino-4-deoxy-L-arabinose transferase-like glycosyltransferase
MKELSLKLHIIIIFILVLLSCVLRLALFSGFVLGDDPAYADLVAQIISGSYPQIGTHGVFSCRPLVLYPVALCIYLFGWVEWSFVLTILVASLLNIIMVYLAGYLLCSPFAGILGALAYMTFPLDAVHATTLSNDILLSTFLWSGGLLFFISCQRYQYKKYIILSGISGLVVGAAVAVKFNAVITPVFFLSAGIICLRKRLRQGAYKSLIAWSGGWIIANCLLCAFLYALSGDIFAHYHAEMRFNLDYNPSGFSAGRGNLMQFLLMYPKWILTILREGHYGYTFPPYGYFYLFYFLCIPLVLFKRFRAARLPALCALFFLVVMEFAPLRLLPHYVPIHRLPRFLHIAAIPAAAVIGIVFFILNTIHQRSIKIISWTVFIVLMSSSLYWSWIKAVFYKDCALDQRWAWDKTKNITAGRIVTDMEMRNYLMFRSGFNPREPIDSPDKLPKTLPERTLVIYGGSRRPEIYPAYSLDWGRGRINKNLQLVAESPFSLKPWRMAKLKIYLTSAGENGRTKQESQEDEIQEGSTSSAIPRTNMPGLKKIAEIDVGDTDSEKDFDYQITETTWTGVRDFSYARGERCEDDGRAYRGSEKITLHNLARKQPLYILKRFDPAVKQQQVEVKFNREFIGNWNFKIHSADSFWQESIFIIPAKYVNDTSGTVEFRFQKSDSDINSFYYWFFQPE